MKRHTKTALDNSRKLIEERLDAQDALLNDIHEDVVSLVNKMDNVTKILMRCPHGNKVKTNPDGETESVAASASVPDDEQIHDNHNAPVIINVTHRHQYFQHSRSAAGHTGGTMADNVAATPSPAANNLNPYVRKKNPTTADKENTQANLPTNNVPGFNQWANNNPCPLYTANNPGSKTPGGNTDGNGVDSAGGGNKKDSFAGPLHEV